MRGGSPGGRPVPFAVPEHLEVVDSTNRYLLDLARAGLDDGSEVPEGYAVVAERQSEGRGRLQRRWEAPTGTAVLCSILFRPDLPPEDLHLVPWAVALAALEACREVAGVELAPKWPNDLLAAARGSLPERAASMAGSEGRKVAGVLSEILPPRTARDPDGGLQKTRAAMVVGIGINVNWPPGWPPPESKDPDLVSIAEKATALNQIAGREIDRDELVARMLSFARSRHAMLGEEKGQRIIASQYRQACSTIGRVVRVELPDEIIVGRALDIDDSGSLLVETGACIRTIVAGDLVHLR